MAAMSLFEIRANNIETALKGARSRVEGFGYVDDPVEEVTSRVAGMFVTWLTSCEEARHQQKNAGATFSKNVIDVLPVQDDPIWKSYIEPKPNSTLKQRAMALWGIRIAYTHGDGDIDLVTNERNKQYILDAPNALDGVCIKGSKLILTGFSYHVAIRTMVQLRDVFPLG